MIIAHLMKIILAKQAKVQFAYFVQRDQSEIIAIHLSQDKFLFRDDVFVATAVEAS